jgi:hypothetical protein
MAHDFSPIDSEVKYKAALEYLMAEGSRLAETILGEQLIPDTLTVFSRTKEEYDFIDGLIRTYGPKSRFSHGITLYIDVAMEVSGNQVVLLGVREPDNDRQDVGYADFSVQNYAEIRNANTEHIQEITTSRGQSLLELRHPDFDVRGYLVSANEHGTLLEELSHDLEEYHQTWHELVATRQDRVFFESLIPTAVAWKVFDRAELDRCVMNIRSQCDQLHFGWVNDRWLVTLHLMSEALPGNIRIIKLMERRPGSSDPVGLDHIDFLVPNGDAKTVLAKEPNLTWSEESNGNHCKWLSLWLDGTEAKLRTDTVLQVCADELLVTQERLLT